jgi:hypothetical protein
MTVNLLNHACMHMSIRPALSVTVEEITTVTVEEITTYSHLREAHEREKQVLKSL